MPLLVLQATGSVAQMGLVTGTFGVGQLVSGIFSGPLIDRVDRRRLMVLCDLGRTLLYGSIPLVWLMFGPQMWLIYVVAGLGALLGNTFQVGSITAVANLVKKSQLTEANGRSWPLSASLSWLAQCWRGSFRLSSARPPQSVSTQYLSWSRRLL